MVPILTVFAAAVLEFGMLFLERQAVQTGVRDAARYLALCRVETGRCSETMARNLAFTATLDGSGAARLPGWGGAADDLVVTGGLPPASGVVTVTGRFEHGGSPLFDLLNLPPLVITARHQERWLAW